MNITFDYFKIELPQSSVIIKRPDEFSHHLSKQGVETHLHYIQKIPFGYKIDVDLTRKITTVSFTGKALLENYPSLINATNISECFANINKKGVCYINPQTAVTEAVVSECDVTSDIHYSGSIRDLQGNLILKNRNYTISKTCINRFYIRSTSVTRRKEENMVIYDKSEELASSPNKPFLDAVLNRTQQVEYFSNKIRFELNLRSRDRLRKYFQCHDLRLQSLLDSPMDPIASFLEQSVYSASIFDNLIDYAPKLRDLEHTLLLSACGFDLREVEAVVRRTTSKKGSITNYMRPYRSIYDRVRKNGIDPLTDIDSNYLQTSIQNILTKVFSSMNDKGNTAVNPLTLYNKERHQPDREIFNPFFFCNLPYIRLPVLPD